MTVKELDHAQVLSILPDRDPWGHKGTFGKVLLLCGSKGFTGAAYLAATGALRSGAGLVFLGVPECIYSIEAVKLHEPVVFPLPDSNGKLSTAALEWILQRLPDMDAVLIGCGLGISEDTGVIVRSVLEQAQCPVILDADGITLMSRHKDILRGRRYPTVLTPHDGEFMRFGGKLSGDRLVSAVRYAREWNCILLLKGHETYITDGSVCYRNKTGNPGMAVGGSGDVLAGILTAFVGQGIPPLEAAACAAFVHGMAGDRCAQTLGQYGMLPTDMLQILPRLLK